MAKKDLFATVLRGFHKEEVTRYLNELLRKFEGEKEDIRKKYIKERDENRELNRKLALLREENTTLAKDLLEANRKAGELAEALEQAKQMAKSGSTPQQVMFSETNLNKLRQLADQIKNKMEQARKMEAQAKEQSEQIIKEAQQQRQIILSGNATAQADEIGKKQHEEMAKETQEQYEEVMRQAREEKERIVAQAKAEKEKELLLLRDEIIKTKQEITGMMDKMDKITIELDQFAVPVSAFFEKAQDQAEQNEQAEQTEHKSKNDIFDSIFSL